MTDEIKPALWGAYGSSPGLNVRVKALSIIREKKKVRNDAHIVSFEIPSFKRVAISVSRKDEEGSAKRCFIIEPSSFSNCYEVGSFFIQGNFFVSADYNKSHEAAQMYREFEPE